MTMKKIGVAAIEAVAISTNRMPASDIVIPGYSEELSPRQRAIKKPFHELGLNVACITATIGRGQS